MTVRRVLGLDRSAADIAAVTPPQRDRSLDLLRAVAIPAAAVLTVAFPSPGEGTLGLLTGVAGGVLAYIGALATVALYFVGDDQTMLATIPAEGRRTPYAFLGDVIAWASVLALVIGAGVLGLSGLRRRARLRRARR